MKPGSPPISGSACARRVRGRHVGPPRLVRQVENQRRSAVILLAFNKYSKPIPRQFTTSALREILEHCRW